MKRLLTITILMFITLLYSQSKFDINNLIDRGGLKYAPNDEEPYTGKVFDFFENGEKKLDGNYRKGLINGKWTYYHENGQIRAQGRFIDGDGSNLSESTGIPFNGRKGKWSFWYENGQKMYEGTYKDGELIKETYWGEDGNEMNVGVRSDEAVGNIPDISSRKEYNVTAAEMLSQAEQLRETRKYLEAIKKLEVLLESFPDSPEAPNAQVVIAQIYMGYQNDFFSAVTAFRKVVTNFPESDQAQNAQFMMGYIYANHLNDKEMARTEFQKFIDLYSGEVEEYFLESAKAELRAIED